MAVPYRNVANRRRMVTPRAMMWCDTVDHQTKWHAAGPELIADKFHDSFQEIKDAAARWLLEEITRRDTLTPMDVDNADKGSIMLRRHVKYSRMGRIPQFRLPRHNVLWPAI